MKTCMRRVLPIILVCQFIDASFSLAMAQNVPPSDIVVSEGSQHFSAESLQGVTNLSVSQGAVAVIDFSTAGSVSLAGNLTNSGSIYAVSNTPGTTASFNSLNIFNNSGALLTSVLPSGGISGYSNAISNLNLSLNAVQNIVNSGTISSAGSLAMSAASIANQGTMAAISTITAITQQNLINAGTIASSAGNINITALAAHDLLINNTNGTLQALLGNISLNATNSDALHKLTMAICGGDLVAKCIDITNIKGNVEVDVAKIDGALNITAGAAHVTAATPTLTIGQMNLTGDPTFYNTAGDILITTDLDLRPNTSIVGASALAIVASGNISASNGVTFITTNAAPNTLKAAGDPSSYWDGNTTGGSIWLVAGASFTATPTDASTSSVSYPSKPLPPFVPFNPPGDTTNTLTISGRSSSGGNVMLTGVSLNTQSGYAYASGSSGSSGDVMIAAYSDGAGNNGNIQIGDINTAQYQPNPLYNGLGNGNVTIVGEGGITTGAIQTGSNGQGTNPDGNITNLFLNNGNILVASASIMMLEYTNTSQAQSFTPAYTVLAEPAANTWAGDANGAASPGMTQLTLATYPLNSYVPTTGMTAGQTLYIDPLGPSHEVVTLSSTATIGSTNVVLSGSITKYHASNEFIYQSASSIKINPGAGVVGTTPLAQNGAVFAPDYGNLASGAITIGGAVTGTGAVTIATNGTVNIQSSMTLSQNPGAYTGTPTQAGYYRNPVIDIFGGTGVTIGAAGNINSSIGGCKYCANQVNIVTPLLTNNGTISGGTYNAATFSNSLVSVTSLSGLTIAGSGTFSAPGYSVIELSAADKSTLNLTSSQTFQMGENSILIWNAQSTGGTVNISADQTITTGTTGPIVSINTPNLNLGGAAGLTVTAGNARYLITSGFSQETLNIGVTGAVSFTGGPANIGSPTTANVVLTANAGGTWSFSGPAQISVSGGAIATVPNGLFTGTVPVVSNPSGKIVGYAFQPAVGGRLLAGQNAFASDSGYPYQVVIALLGNAMAAADTSTGGISQQFQLVSTYTQSYSKGYVVQAAKQLGLRVSAGVWAQIEEDPLGSMTQANYDRFVFDAQAATYLSKSYGNVQDIVVGNENIVTASGGTAQPSIQTLTTLLNGGSINIEFVGPQAVVGVRNMPGRPMYPGVTTRQESGVLNLVSDPTVGTAMIALVNSCEGYIYGNYYPFFNENKVVPAILQNPSMSETQFKTLVTTQMSADYDFNALQFTLNSVGTYIKVGETGWATPMPDPTTSPLTGYNGTDLPQQNTQWAGWYYQAMQDWSITHPNMLNPQSTPGVFINGYFEAYNEPPKGISGKDPNQIPTQVAVGGVAAGSPTLPTTGGANFNNLTPMSVLINPNTPVSVTTTEEVQNIYAINGNTLTISQTNFPATLQFPHVSGEPLKAGTPEEPFFGVFVANGSSYYTSVTKAAVTTYVGYNFNLTGITQQYSIGNYKAAAPPPPPAPPPVAASAPATTNFSLFSPATLLALNASVNSAVSSSRTLSGSTIIPTDVNPERLSPEDSNPSPGLGDSRSQEALSYNASNLLPNPADSAVSLLGGHALLFPDHDLTVNTPTATVKVKAGTAVLLFQSEAGLGVFNLFDNQTGGVAVTVGDETSEVPVGRQLVLSEGNGKSDQVNPRGIGYRNILHGRLGPRKSVSSEFSLVSALAHSSGLRKLLNSSDPDDVLRARKIMKTAAALAIIGKNKSPFKTQ